MDAGVLFIGEIDPQLFQGAAHLLVGLIGEVLGAHRLEQAGQRLAGREEILDLNEQVHLPMWYKGIWGVVIDSFDYSHNLEKGTKTLYIEAKI